MDAIFYYILHKPDIDRFLGTQDYAILFFLLLSIQAFER